MLDPTSHPCLKLEEVLVRIVEQLELPALLVEIQKYYNQFRKEFCRFTKKTNVIPLLP
jgi:hypothetical protein